MGRPLRVFLCHASQDKPEVRRLFNQLLSDGVDAWLDEEKLIPGQAWHLEISKAVKDSDLILVCLSKNSINKDGYIQKEIRLALDIADEKPEGKVFLIPVKLEECEVPERLKNLQWVKLFEVRGYKKLLQSLEIRSREVGAKVIFKSDDEGNLIGYRSDNREKKSVKYGAIVSANKWILFGLLGAILMGFFLGANLTDATWLNPEITAIEAQRLTVETAHQQAIFEMEERLLRAETDFQIQKIQQEQESYDAHYQHDLQILEQDLENRKVAFETLMATIRHIGIAISFAIILGSILGGVSKILTLLRCRS